MEPGAMSLIFFATLVNLLLTHRSLLLMQFVD